MIHTELGAMRPALMVRAAEMAAALYRRRRDLPGAVSGLLARPEAEILPALRAREAMLEEQRRARAPGYRPAKHLQALTALLAESRDAAVLPMKPQNRAAGVRRVANGG